MLLAQSLLQSMEVFFLLLLCAGARFRHLLLKLLRSGIEMLSDRLGDLLGKAVRILLNGLQLLRHLLPESIQSLADLLLDHGLGGSQDLRRLLLGLLQHLCSQVFAQPYPQFLFYFGWNVRQRYVELAAFRISLRGPFFERHHFRMQRLDKFRHDGPQVILCQLRLAFFRHDFQRGYARLILVDSALHFLRGLPIV